MNESEFSNARANVGEGEGQGSAAAPQPELLPLDLPERVIMFKSRETGATRRHIFNRITRADVDAYFSSMTVATEQKNGNVEYHIDMRTNVLKLYERAIKRVEGYSLTDGRDVMELPNWKDRIPGVHRLRAAEIAMKVSQTESGGADLGIDPEADLVSLDAFWSAGDSGMTHYCGLLHRFSPPALEHWRKLNNHSTRTTAVGGSQSKRTLYPKMNTVYGELYDALILSATGYSFCGQPIGGREQIAREMDTFHKIAAISILFEKPAGGEAEDLEEA